MAKKRTSKAKRARRRAPAISAPVRRRVKQAMPLGLAVGGTLAGIHAATAKGHGSQFGPTYGTSPWGIIKSEPTNHVGAAETITRVKSTVLSNMTDPEFYIPLGVGAFITIIGPKIPVVGRPVNRLVKRASKKAVSL